MQRGLIVQVFIFWHSVYGKFNDHFLALRIQSYTTPKSLRPLPPLDNFQQTSRDLEPRMASTLAASAASKASLRSFSIKSQAKPPSYCLPAGALGEYPGIGLQVSTDQHLAEETLITLASIFSSMPSFFPMASDSAIPIIWIAKDILLHNLAIWPPLDFPQLKKFFPMPSSTGLHLLNICSFYAPTMKVSVPAAAPVTPPETGASTQVIPTYFAFLFRSAAAMGDIVLQSIINESFLAFLNNPSADSHTLQECSVLGNIVIKISASFAISFKALNVMFFVFAQVALLASASLPKTWCPFAARFAAMGRPIFPRPMKPILEKENNCLVTNLISFLLFYIK